PLFLASGAWTLFVLINWVVLPRSGGPEIGFAQWGYWLLFGYSIPIFIIFGVLLFLFPRGQALEARSIFLGIITVAIGCGMLFFCVFIPNSRTITFEVTDESGTPV